MGKECQGIIGLKGIGLPGKESPSGTERKQSLPKDPSGNDTVFDLSKTSGWWFSSHAGN